ncbi:MAG: pgl [Frankiales bacterium]|nr:pgl [Frankiales bacterium]
MSAEPQLQRVQDADACATAAAQLVADAVRSGARHLVLAGGTTPLQAYARLDAMDVPWHGVHLWYGDERCVPFDHPDSNHGAVAARLRATGAHWHPMPGTLGPDAGAEAYERELQDADAGFDLVLNGMGPDGHTASLFPHHEALHAAGLTAGIRDAPKPPPERITLTLGALNSGRRLVLLVTGAGKAQALARVLAGSDPGTPSSLLARDRLLILADTAALGA